MAALSLVFDLIGRDISASKAFGNVGNAAEKAGKQSHTAGSLISSGMKMAGGALLGAGLIEGFKSLYEQAAESARIGRLTAQVITSTGGAAKISAKQVGDLATAISNKTGVDDEAIQSGENLLLTFTNVHNEVGKGNDIFNQAAGLVTDMSVALGKDLSGSAIQVGKALNDPIKGITALAKAGVSFTEQQKDQIKTLVASGKTLDAQKIILGELSKEFGGAAAAAATPLDKLKVSLGNLAENLGGYLIPVVDKAAGFLNNYLIPAFGNLSPALGTAGDVIGTIADDVGHLIGFFNNLPGPVKVAIGIIGGIAAIKGPVSSALSTIKDVAETMYLKLLEAGSAGGVAKAGLGGMSSFLGGPWGIAIAAAGVALSFLVSWLGKTDEATKRTKQAQDDYSGAIREANGLITENVRQAAAKAAQDTGLLDIAQKLGVSLPTVTDAITNQGSSLDSTRSALKSFIDSHTLAASRSNQFGTQLDSEGKSAQDALDSLNKLAGTTGATSSKQEQLASATGHAATAAGGAKEAIKAYAAELDDSSKSASDAKKQTDLFKLSLDILTGAHVSLIQVESAFQDSVASATGAMKDLHGSVLTASGGLNLQSEAGRKASGILLNVRDSANTLISTMVEQGATAAQVEKADARMRDGFIQSARQMGISKTAAGQLADQILGIPKERNTKITADVAQASGGIAGIQKQLDHLSSKTINIMTNYRSSGGLVGNARAQAGFAEGGFTGMGGKYTPAGIVHKGEFVFPQEAVKRLGVGMLGALAGLPGYAGGGPVLSFRGYTGGLDAAAKALSSAQSKTITKLIPASGGAGRWLGTVLAVLSALGQSSSLAGGILNLIQAESGGNPSAINLWDSNARAGHPSQGLMQTIPSTFYAYAGPYGGRGITDPFANIYAGVNYALHRYGASMLAGGGRHTRGGAYVGYKDGTNWVPADGPAYLHKGEAVVPAAKNQGSPYKAPNVNVRVFVGNQEIQDIARIEVDNALGGVADLGHNSLGF